MFLDTYRRNVEHAFPEGKNRDALLADFSVAEAIYSEYEKDRSSNPLVSPIVIELAKNAIEAWGGKTDDDVDRYLAELLDVYPILAEILEEAKFGLDVEVAVEADTAEETPKTSVKLHGHPLSNDWVFEEVVKCWPRTEDNSGDHNRE